MFNAFNFAWCKTNGSHSSITDVWVICFTRRRGGSGLLHPNSLRIASCNSQNSCLCIASWSWLRFTPIFTILPDVTPGGSNNDEQDVDNPSYSKQELIEILERIGARYSENVGPDTTHLLCNSQGGSEYQRALEGSIPIVKPDWLVACEKAGVMQPALPYYLVPRASVSEESNRQIIS